MCKYAKVEQKMKDKSWTSFKGPHKLESVGDNKKPGTEEWSTYQTALQKKEY